MKFLVVVTTPYIYHLVKSKLLWIDVFNYEGFAVINVRPDLTVGVIEHIYITYKIDLYPWIKYTELILRN